MNRTLTRRLGAGALAIGAITAAAGCGSGAGGPSAPKVQPARSYTLASLVPRGAVNANAGVPLSFTIRTPDGAPLTRFRRGPGPHTGVHLIVVRKDLGLMLHLHPRVGPNGAFGRRITFPTPGPYRVLVDAFPAAGSGLPSNFQLSRDLRVAGSYRPVRLSASSTTTVDGYRVALVGTARLRALRASSLTATVTDPAGRPVRFGTLYGALAHAVLFHRGDLAYYHTHVCAPGASGCMTGMSGMAGMSGMPGMTGGVERPGVLRIGMLLPERGTWRLFLQVRVDVRVLTAPFTLAVR